MTRSLTARLRTFNGACFLCNLGTRTEFSYSRLSAQSFSTQSSLQVLERQVYISRILTCSTLTDPLRSRSLWRQHLLCLSFSIFKAWLGTLLPVLLGHAFACRRNTTDIFASDSQYRAALILVGGESWKPFKGGLRYRQLRENCGGEMQ